MKIAVAIERFNPVGSGRERATFQIVEELLRRDHHVTVLCGDAPAKLDLEGGEIRRGKVLDFKHQPKVKPFALWARKILASGEFETSLSVTTSTPAAVMQPRTGTLVGLLRQQQHVPQLASPKLIERILGKVFSSKAALVALERKAITHPMIKRFAVLSQRAALELAGDFGIDAARIDVVPNGTNLQAYEGEQRADIRRQIREGFGIDEQAVAFLFAAYNPDLKGLTPLLHALKRLKVSAKKVVLICAGNFPYHHQQLAAALGVRDHVKVVGVTDHMADLFATSDVAAHPTFYDAGSRTVIESLAMGLPVISSRFDGASENVVSDGDEHAPRGIVIDDPNDETALGAAMQTMLDESQRHAFTTAMVGLAKQFSLQRHVDALERMLRDAAN